MPAANSTMSPEAKEALRAAALARHAERKQAGLPAPSGKPYITPPDPTPPPVVEPPQPVVVGVPVAAVPAGPLTPRQLFLAWLRSNPGRDAADTRLSSDPVRFSIELEDRLFIAFQAGLKEGRDG